MTQLNKNKRVCFLAALSIGLMLSGCTARTGNLTLASTRDIDLSGNVKLNIGQSKRYFGEDCHFYLLGALPIGGNPQLSTAVERALVKGKGNIMVNEATEISDVWVVLGDIKCVSVEGNVLSVPYKPYPTQNLGTER